MASQEGDAGGLPSLEGDPNYGAVCGRMLSIAAHEERMRMSLVSTARKRSANPEQKRKSIVTLASEAAHSVRQSTLFRGFTATTPLQETEEHSAEAKARAEKLAMRWREKTLKSLQKQQKQKSGDTSAMFARRPRVKSDLANEPLRSSQDKERKSFEGSISGQSFDGDAVASSSGGEQESDAGEDSSMYEDDTIDVSDDVSPEMKEELKRVMRGFGLVHRAEGANPHDGDILHYLPEFPKYIIDPDSFFKSCWDWFVVLLVLYNSFKIPFDLAYTESEAENKWIQFFEDAVDVCFALDIILTLRTGYYDRFGIAVMETKLIWKRYLYSWLGIDLLATIPFEHILLIFPGGRKLSSQVDILPLLKCPRLLRLGRLLKKMEALAAANAFRIIKLLLLFLLVAHWVGCGWYYIGAHQTAENRWTAVVGIEGDLECIDSGVCEEVTTSDKFVTSIYWALTTMTTVGYGDITANTNTERIWVVGVFLLGAIIYSSIFANVSMLLQTFDAQGLRYREKMDSINELLRFHEVPADLAEKVRGNIEYYWSLTGGFDLSDNLNHLPLALRIEVCMTMYEKIVRQVPMFAKLDRALIQQLVIRMRPQAALPGSYVFREGDLGYEIWFVGAGVLHVTDAEGKHVYNTIGAGAMFGENVLFFGRRRLASVRAATHVELYSVTQTDFEDIMRFFPHEMSYILKIAETQKQMQRKSNQLTREEDERRESSLAEEEPAESEIELEDVQSEASDGGKRSNRSDSVDEAADPRPKGLGIVARMEAAKEESDAARLVYSHGEMQMRVGGSSTAAGPSSSTRAHRERKFFDYTGLDTQFNSEEDIAHAADATGPTTATPPSQHETPGRPSIVNGRRENDGSEGKGPSGGRPPGGARTFSRISSSPAASRPSQTSRGDAAPSAIPERPAESANKPWNPGAVQSASSKLLQMMAGPVAENAQSSISIDEAEWSSQQCRRLMEESAGVVASVDALGLKLEKRLQESSQCLDAMLEAYVRQVTQALTQCTG